MPEFALVTGGSTGIGAAIVTALEADGFEVLAVSRRSGVDLTRPGACDELVGRLDRLDLLVNNAGIAESAPAAKTSDEALATVTSTLNVDVPFRLCRAAYPKLREASANPRIIQIASVVGPRAARPTSPRTRRASTRSWDSRACSRQEWKRQSSVHAVCPGFVDTPMTERSVANITEPRPEMSADEARAALAEPEPERPPRSRRRKSAKRSVRLAHAETTGSRNSILE